MMTATEPHKMNGKGADQEIIVAIKQRMSEERRKKLLKLLAILSIGTLCTLMAILGEYTACAIFYLCLIIYEELRNRP